MKKVQSFLCVFLCVVFCLVHFSFYGVEVYAADMTAPSLSGTTYKIVSASNLRWISGVCNGDVKSGTKNYPSNPSFKGYTIVLNNDVSVGNVVLDGGKYILSNGEKWVPIGTEKTPFSGIFEGGEYKIDGVFVSDTEKYSGFFGNVSGGTIQSLVVEGYINGNGSVGGIVGKLSLGKINDCVFFGGISGVGKTGGIVGEAVGKKDNPSDVSMCIASCDIITDGGESSGGVVGTAEFANISVCSSGGTLYSLSRCTAGILGEALEGVFVDRCSSFDTMTADGDETYAGGILGLSSYEVDLKNNSFGGLIYCAGKNVSLCGGIAGSFIGKIENSFVSGIVCSSLSYDESEDFTVEKICASAGIAAKAENGIINNCYFSGATECQGLEGNDICSDKWNPEVNNVFYIYDRAAFLLYGTQEAYGVAELLNALTKWVGKAGDGYASWLSASGVNGSSPLLKYSDATGSNGKCAWKVEDGVFTFYAEGAMDDFETNGFGLVDSPWALYRLSVNTVNIKEGVTRIGNNAFNAFEKLKTVNLPSTLLEIGDYAFELCEVLKTISIPESVSDIGAGAFRRCDALTKIVIPNGVRAVRKYTFSYCKKLSSVTIPESVSLIGRNAFAMCDSLVKVSLPQSVREIDEYAFYWCEKLSSVSLPQNLNRIGEYAFGKCDALTDYDIPKDTTVEKNAFWSVLEKGDVDGDGRYTVFDYLKIKAHFLGVSSMTKTQIKAADSDFDGVITVTDYLSVKMNLMGVK